MDCRLARPTLIKKGLSPNLSWWGDECDDLVGAEEQKKVATELLVDEEGMKTREKQHEDQHVRRVLAKFHVSCRSPIPPVFL